LVAGKPKRAIAGEFNRGKQNFSEKTAFETFVERKKIIGPLPDALDDDL
jgi:hypothetical protein